MRNWLRTLWLSGGLWTWLICAAVFGTFLIYPVGRLLVGALQEDGNWRPGLLLLPLQYARDREMVVNSLLIGVGVTVLASCVGFPLAWVVARFRFPGKSLLTGLLLVPLLLPPLVGAVGLRQMLAREGMVNTLLLESGLFTAPIDFLQARAPMVILVAALHLYPLIYLNTAASWANLDPSLHEAAESQGAGGWRIFRDITLPLLLPGYAAGALIVFVFAFTDLGTPLVFNYTEVAAVRILHERVNPDSPMGYVLALWLTTIACVVFVASRRLLSGSRIATFARAAAGEGRERTPSRPALVGIYTLLFCVIGVALLPHAGVIIASFGSDWTNRLLPEWTLENYARLLQPRSDAATLAASSIRISLFCASISMLLDVLGGFALAYMLARRPIPGKAVLDAIAMLPLALPGLVLAFSLLMAFRGTFLDPLTANPLPLLIISYALRRLPYALRAVSAGLQQMSQALEESSHNLGATPWQTVRFITVPLVLPNLLAAGLLTFAFAVLEVSDSLILAADRNYAPIAQAIYQLTLQVTGGLFMACALGVVGMILLTATFLITNRLLGRQMGTLFRV